MTDTATTSTKLDPDLAPNSEAFEAAYNLPDYFPQPLKDLHAEIITALRNESRALPMSMSLRMLTERMAYFYVAMKWREQQDDIGLKEQKEMLDFWLKIMTEFNKLIQASSDKARTTLLLEIQNTLRASLKVVKQKAGVELSRELSDLWNEDFARMDI